jgi:hypothetical protein
MWFVIFAMLTGTLLYGMLVGHIFSMMESMDVSHQQYKERLDQVTAYLKGINADSATRNKVLDYYKLKYPKEKYYDADAIIKELNSSLRVRCRQHCKTMMANLIEQVICRRNIEQLLIKFPFFRSCPRQLNYGIMDTLETVYVLEGQSVIEQGSFGCEMYFIQSGTLEVLVNGTLMRFVSEDMHIGGKNGVHLPTTFPNMFIEEGIFHDYVKRKYELRALTNAVLLKLYKEKCVPLIMEYPEIGQMFKEYGVHHVKIKL